MNTKTHLEVVNMLLFLCPQGQKMGLVWLEVWALTVGYYLWDT